MSFTTAQAPTIASPFHLDTNTIIVSLSDAEAKVIEYKAKKAASRQRPHKKIGRSRLPGIGEC